MEPQLKSQIRQVALGYGLEYKITDMRMRDYLAPAYLLLRQNHPELCFADFTTELVTIRAEEREKGTAYEFKEYGIKACLCEMFGDANSARRDL